MDDQRLFQGWGWPPCSKSLNTWYSRNERGLWWAIWNTSHNLGGALIPILSGAVALYWGWRYGMIVPGIIACVIGFALCSYYAIAQHLWDFQQSVNGVMILLKRT